MIQDGFNLKSTVEIDKDTSDLISAYCAFHNIQKKIFIKNLVGDNKELIKFKEKLKVMKFK